MSWDFNAPQYVDFNRSSLTDDSIEKYFDVDHEHDGLTDVAELLNSSTISMQEAEMENRNPLKDGTDQREDNDSIWNERVLSNVCVSFSARKNRNQAKITTTTTLRSTRQKKKPAKTNAERDSSPTMPPLAKRFQDKTRRRFHGSFQSAESKSRDSQISSSSASTENLEDTLVTTSETNRILPKDLNQNKTKSKRGGPSIKSSEELEMERIEALRKEAELQKNLSKESFAKALAAKQPDVGDLSRYQKPKSMGKTQPIPFHFATDGRLKDGPKENFDDEVKDFAHSLRQSDPALYQKPWHKMKTQMEPFNLCTTLKRKRDDDKPVPVQPVGYKFQSMAEKLFDFSNKTPERFKKKPEKSSSPRTSSISPGLVIARSPKLKTKLRHRPTTLLSSQQKEELELEEMKKNRFRALPLNERILSQPDKLKAVPAKPGTVVEPFHLTAVSRNHDETSTSDGDVVAYEFHANPVPKAVYHKDVVTKAMKLTTIPQSPDFTYKKNPLRQRKELETDQTSQGERVMKAIPAPKFNEPFHPSVEHRHTEVQPFSFEEKTREMFAKKEMKILHILQEEIKAREFVANPMPDLSPDVLKKIEIPLTQTVPFKLTIDERGAEKAKKFEEKIEEQERKVREAALFKARLPTVLYADPFQPQKIDHPTIEFEPFKLKTEERVEKWKEVEVWQKRKEEQEEEERRERERRRLFKEESEIRRIRREAVHLAKPIRQYKPVVDKEELPLTDPCSPNFSERLKFPARK